MKAKKQMNLNGEIIPGPVRAAEKPAGALSIELLRKPTEEELLDPAVGWTWRALSVIYYKDKARHWTGLKELQAMAHQLRADCTLHSFRRGIRELVDFGVITCDPNPGIGERIPD